MRFVPPALGLCPLTRTCIFAATDILNNPEKRTRYDYILDHPLEHYANYARHYARNVQTSPVTVLGGLLVLVTVLDFLYRQKRYHDMRATCRRDPKVQFKLREAKKTFFDSLKAAATKKTPLKYKNVDAIPDSDISLESIGITLSGPYAKLPTWESLLVYRMLFWPAAIVAWVTFQTRWFLTYTIGKQEYSAADAEYLCARALGVSDLVWKEGASADERALYVMRRIWLPANLAQLKLDHAKAKAVGKSPFALLNRKVVSERGDDVDVEW